LSFVLFLFFSFWWNFLYLPSFLHSVIKQVSQKWVVV
jgi:hypothetical protein